MSSQTRDNDRRRRRDSSADLTEKPITSILSTKTTEKVPVKESSMVSDPKAAVNQSEGALSGATSKTPSTASDSQGTESDSGRGRGVDMKQRQLQQSMKLRARRHLPKVEHHYKEWPDYSDYIIYMEEDFISIQKNKAIVTTADLKFDGELERELYTDLQNREYLFNQRRTTGSVAIHPAKENPQLVDIFYLIARSRSIYAVEYQALRESVQALRKEMENRNRSEVAVCVSDGGRGGIRWGKFYRMLDEVFEDSGMRVYACKFFYTNQRGDKTLAGSNTQEGLGNYHGYVLVSYHL